MMFFDSHGSPWESCDDLDRGAVAFGPTGISRPIEDPRLARIMAGSTNPRDTRPSRQVAIEERLLLVVDGWDCVGDLVLVAPI